MEIKAKNFFSAALAVAVGTLTFESVRDNYDTIKEKFSNEGKKIIDGIKGNSKDQEIVKGEDENE